MGRKFVKVATIQTKNYSSNVLGVKRIASILEKAGKKEAEIVCLPEQWLKNNYISNIEEEFSQFFRIAKEFSLWIISGAFYFKEKNHLRISSPVINNKGQIEGVQEKIHPFDYEKKIIKPGRVAKIFQGPCKFGILVCYDLVFPYVSRNLALKGAEILFSPSRIVRRGIKPWHLYGTVRSLENRLPVVASNVENRKFGGNSFVVELCEKKGVVIPNLIKNSVGESLRIKKIEINNLKKNQKTRFNDSKNNTKF